MGMLYYIICQDCTEILDLYKFWGWRIVPLDAQLDEDILKKEQEKLVKYLESDDDGYYWKDWVRSASRILAFLSVHNGHRITVVDERSKLVEATRLKRMIISKEPDIEDCTCGHHFGTHLNMDAWERNTLLGPCCLCRCKQFTSRVEDA